MFYTHTIAECISHASIDRLDTELLLAYILRKERSYIKAHPEQQLTYIQQLRFLWYVHQRKRHIPLAYITGHKEFFGLDFKVNTHTLVPRPETEQMVELALSRITNYISRDKHIVLIDIGTGSGCIPISILSTLNNKYSIGHVQCAASDISQKALTIAQRNAARHNVNITFKQGNLLEPWMNELNSDPSLVSRVIITANLPYITEEQWQDEQSIKKEPKSALVAGEQGLALYRELLEEIKKTNLQSPISICFEIDPSQKEHMNPLIHHYLPNSRITIHDDLCGNARIVEIRVD